MTLLIPAFHHSELIDRLVLNSRSLEKLGHVSQLYIDLKMQQIAYLACEQQGLGSNAQIIPWSNIDSFDTESIFVAHNPGSNRRKFNGTSDLIGFELWSSSGNKVGEIKDYIFDVKTGQIQEYLFVRRDWQGFYEGLHRLRAGAVINISTQRILAFAQAIQNAEPCPDEWSEKLNRLVSFFSTDDTNNIQNFEPVIQSA